MRTNKTKKRKHKSLIISSAILAVLCVAFAVNAARNGIEYAVVSLVLPITTTEMPEIKANDDVKVSVVEDEKNTPSLPATTTLSLPLYGDKPSILIYHTHTLEAYTPSEKYPYEESGGKWRTHDETKNIVAVGERLAENLRQYGFNVIHDKTNHEPPKLSSAYSRSAETMEHYKKKYPSLIMFIDVHRDAAGEDTKNDFCTIDGTETARLMFVVGTGKGATGTGFSEMPDFESNHLLAQTLTDYLSSINSELVRPIRVKTGRYNQHVSNKCLLVEVGHNRNTLEQALAAVDKLAEAIAAAASV